MYICVYMCIYIYERMIIRLDEVEDRISDLEDKDEGNTQVEELHEKRLKKYKGTLRELQTNMKYNIQITGIPAGKKKKKDQWIENMFQKIMTENFHTLEKVKDMQV